MNDQVIEAFEEMEAKMAESGMLRIFKLNCEKFGFKVALKACIAFMDDIQEIIDEKTETKE